MGGLLFGVCCLGGLGCLGGLVFVVFCLLFFVWDVWRRSPKGWNVWYLGGLVFVVFCLLFGRFGMFGAGLRPCQRVGTFEYLGGLVFVVLEVW